MPTKIERGFQSQGYTLPVNWTWEYVHAHRREWKVPEHFVPVANRSGLVMWGVPIINGKFMHWREE
jgi:hypothetical protein